MAQLVKNPPANAGDASDVGSVPGLGRYPGEGNGNLLQYPAGKESSCNVGDLGSIPGQARSPGEWNSYPLQYSGLENSMDCIVHGVAKNQTRLSDFHFTLLQLSILPGEFHGRRSLDMTEHACMCAHARTHTHTPVISSFIHSGSNSTLISLLVQPSAAAAAKSLQSCPTLCNPIEGSPPGSPVPGILQARTLEWVAIAFSRFNLLIRA